MGFKKVKAFTLSEMLVVLLLTVIVVGLAFSILGLVQKQMSGIQENYGQRTAENLLRQALWVDFNSCSKIYFDLKSGTLLLGNELGTKQYGFHETYVTRDLDTFYMDIKSKRMYFQGTETSGEIIDALELSMGDEQEGNKQIFVYKKNTATDFMD